jgi:hypothetical protein
MADIVLGGSNVSFTAGELPGALLALELAGYTKLPSSGFTRVDKLELGLDRFTVALSDRVYYLRLNQVNVTEVVRGFDTAFLKARIPRPSVRFFKGVEELLDRGTVSVRTSPVRQVPVSVRTSPVRLTTPHIIRQKISLPNSLETKETPESVKQFKIRPESIDVEKITEESDFGSEGVWFDAFITGYAGNFKPIPALLKFTSHPEYDDNNVKFFRVIMYVEYDGSIRKNLYGLMISGGEFYEYPYISYGFGQPKIFTGEKLPMVELYPLGTFVKRS